METAFGVFFRVALFYLLVVLLQCKYLGNGRLARYSNYTEGRTLDFETSFGSTQSPSELGWGLREMGEPV